MWQRKQIPGYAEAENSERRDRSIAFIGLPERICGIACRPLTPFLLEYLRANGNPFICGGTISEAAILQFIWFVSADFKPEKENQDAFLASVEDLDLSNAPQEIEDYLERAFLDSSNGGPDSKQYYALAAYLVFSMAKEPYRWPMEKTMETSLAVLFQLIKCKERAEGVTVVNIRSDKVASDWLSETITIEAKTIKELERIANERAKEGYWPISEASPIPIVEKDENGRDTIDVTKCKGYSVCMKKGIQPNG